MVLRVINLENALIALALMPVSGNLLVSYRIDTKLTGATRYHHASFSKGGDNPELRCLFFRLRSLAELPILPLFVFDGRERPKVKRGSKMGKSGSHNLTQGLKSLLDIFGMEWRMVSRMYPTTPSLN